MVAASVAISTKFNKIELEERLLFFSDPGTSFSKPHAILNFNFFVGVKKKTFVFFLTAIYGLEKDCFICKTLHFAFCLDFLFAADVSFSFLLFQNKT